jgi:hypothetical protein
MTDKIVGIMWNKNEGDILNESISKALPLVDHLLLSDDLSSDNSWDIIRNRKSELTYISRYGETSGSKKYDKSVWQRQSLLDKAVELFGRNIWIQVIESDLMAIDTNIREQVETKTYVHGIALWWITCEAIRKEWTEKDEKYPNWDKSIQEVMPYGFILEKAAYTWRPYDGVYFTNKWSPVPRGLDKHGPVLGGEWRVRRFNCKPDTPLWGHYNVRGKKHFNAKYKGVDMTRKSVLKRKLCAFEIPHIHPERVFPLTREGWTEFITNNRKRTVRSTW